MSEIDYHKALARLRQRGATAQGDAWAAAIASFDHRGNGDLMRLQEWSLRFLAGELLPIALDQGWNELEIWGAFPAPVEFVRRVEIMGQIGRNRPKAQLEPASSASHQRPFDDEVPI